MGIREITITDIWGWKIPLLIKIYVMKTIYLIVSLKFQQFRNFNKTSVLPRIISA